MTVPSAPRSSGWPGVWSGDAARDIASLHSQHAAASLPSRPGAQPDATGLAWGLLEHPAISVSMAITMRETLTIIAPSADSRRRAPPAANRRYRGIYAGIKRKGV